METKRRKRIKYSPGLPKEMYCFFKSYDSGGIPSFTKFAQSIGATTEDIETFRSHREFERAYRECSQIRRDYLIDNGLTRRFDPSFVKYLLTGEENGEAADELSVNLQVVGDVKTNEA